MSRVPYKCGHRYLGEHFELILIGVVPTLYMCDS